MSFSTGNNYCNKCGKPLGIFEQGLCVECEKAEQKPNIEKLKDKLHDKIEIHVCEVEENTLIAQGMLKALGMMDEVLEKAEQEPCDKCKYFDGNSCQHYDYKVGYTQGYEDASKRFRQEPCDDAISREAVIEILENYGCTNKEGLLFKDIRDLPSVRPTCEEKEKGECPWYAG